MAQLEWKANCGCGFRGDIEKSADHVNKTGHTIDVGLRVRPDDKHRERVTVKDALDGLLD